MSPSSYSLIERLQCIMPMVFYGCRAQTSTKYMPTLLLFFSLYSCRKDTFSINCSDLGTLTKVVIGHDNAGVGPSWFLEGVEVAESGGRAGVVTFPCGRWLEMCGGCGGELEVELFPDVKRSNKNEECKWT